MDEKDLDQFEENPIREIMDKYPDDDWLHDKLLEMAVEIKELEELCDVREAEINKLHRTMMEQTRELNKLTSGK